MFCDGDLYVLLGYKIQTGRTPPRTALPFPCQDTVESTWIQKPSKQAKPSKTLLAEDYSPTVGRLSAILRLLPMG
jgi:hypothetical protein